MVPNIVLTFYYSKSFLRKRRSVVYTSTPRQADTIYEVTCYDITKEMIVE